MPSAPTCTQPGFANLRGAAAILAFTVQGLCMLRSPANKGGLDIREMNLDWSEFGAEALDRLLAQGYDEIDVLKQGLAVFLAIAALLPPTKDEVADTRNLSKATEGGSTT